MSRKVIFRCDAGHAPEIGTGHIARSKTLANNLVEMGLLNRSDIVFYTRDDPDYNLGKKHLRESKFSYKVHTNFELEANSESELMILKRLNASMFIMDRLETSEDLIKGLCSEGSKVVTFDDYGEGRLFADLAISAIFDDVTKTENLFSGYEYLVLSEGLYEPKPVKTKLSNIVATFGGHDARDLCQFFLENLKNLSFACHVNIVLGSCDDSTLLKYTNYVLSNELQDRVEFFIRPINYHEIISNADIAVTSGGLSIFEFAAYGVPSIGLPQYKHQLRTIEKLRNESISFLGSDGMRLSSDVFKDSFDKLANNFDCRKKMAINARKKVDGGGVNKITKLLIDKFPEIFNV